MEIKNSLLSDYSNEDPIDIFKLITKESIKQPIFDNCNGLMYCLYYCKDSKWVPVLMKFIE